MSVDRVVIVTKPTALAELVRRHHTVGAARFALESQGQDIAPYEAEDAACRDAEEATRRAIPGDLPVASVTRADLPRFLFRDQDLVVAVGGDGLFANLAQHIRGQPVIGVNPDPATVAGVLMRFAPEQVATAVAAVLAGRAREERLPFAKATVDGQVLWGINDLFVGRADQVSARYDVEFAGRRERQSSSGVLVSTGVGSTGWMRSVVGMVSALAPGARGPLARLPDPADQELVFVVREAFPSPQTGTSIVTGRVLPGSPLSLVSRMASGGCLFSDGIVERTLAWPAGATATVTVGERHLRRVLPG